MMLTKEKILAILQQHKALLKQLGVRNIGLFGSYVKNSATQNSDIDLLVDFYPMQETFDNLMAVYDLMEKAFKNNKIEIITKNGLSKHIGAYILKETEYV